MDSEFHYYITGFLAERAGFTESEAATIAYASDYVDYNCQAYEIKKKWGDSDGYCNEISQTMDIKKPRSERIHIYPLFHFVPGDPHADSAKRCDGKTHPLNTTPNSAKANIMIDAALSGEITGSDDKQLLHTIGIATHAYVDTWAHQNFIGIEDDFNQIGRDPKPNIGHADAGYSPDIPCLIWEDERLINPLIDNRERFIEAGMALFGKYLQFNEHRKIAARCTVAQMEGELVDLLGYSSKASSMELNRFNRYGRYKQKIRFLEEFDPDKWWHQAVRHESSSYFWKVPKEQTQWFLFQEAVKKHASFTLELIKPELEAAGIDVG